MGKEGIIDLREEATIEVVTEEIDIIKDQTDFMAAGGTKIEIGPQDVLEEVILGVVEALIIKTEMTNKRTETKKEEVLFSEELAEEALLEVAKRTKQKTLWKITGKKTQNS